MLHFGHPITDVDCMNTVCKPVAEYPGYEVDENGQMWSTRGTGRQTLLRPALMNGYRRVALYRDGQPRPAMRLLHTVICETYHGKPPTPAHRATFLNGNRNDYRPANLGWKTPLEIARTHPGRLAIQGDRSGRRKVTSSDVAAIRSQAAAGIDVEHIAERFGLSISHTRNIILRHFWKHTA